MENGLLFCLPSMPIVRMTNRLFRQVITGYVPKGHKTCLTCDNITIYSDIKKMKKLEIKGYFDKSCRRISRDISDNSLYYNELSPIASDGVHRQNCRKACE